MIGQTAEIAPADRKLYALRDVTGTVESPYLICASIMSKKLAEGIDALVLDVKTGSGAFMKSEKDAAFLAELMVETGERMGKQVVALITDMDQPLGCMIGNALEVVEVVELLRGEGPEDLRELCLELAGWMLYLGGVADTVAEGRKQSEKLIASGKALDKFRQMVELQGGDPRAIDDPKKLPQAQHTMTVSSPRSGYLASLQCEQMGTACVILGGGRERKEDSVDPAVGIVLHKKVGDAVSSRRGAGDDPLQCRSARGACPEIAGRELSDCRFAAAREKAFDPSRDDPARDRKARREKLNGTLHWNPRPFDHAGIGLCFFDESPRDSAENGRMGTRPADCVRDFCAARGPWPAHVPGRGRCRQPRFELCVRGLGVCVWPARQAGFEHRLYFRLSGACPRLSSSVRCSPSCITTASCRWSSVLPPG